MSRYSRARKVHSSTVEGRRAVLEALRSGRSVDRLLIADGLEMGAQMREIFSLVESLGVEAEFMSRQQLDRQSRTKKSQGVVLVLPDLRYASVEDMIFAADGKGEQPLIAVLDGILDPHNLGAIARTLDAAGGHGVIIPERRAAGVTPGAMRASAGALMHVPVARVVNINRTLEHLGYMGVQLVGLDADGDVDYTEVDFSSATAVVVGSEEKGLSRLAMSRCDLLVSIPMHGQLSSLNASVSAGIVLYEAERQRRLSE